MGLFLGGITRVMGGKGLILLGCGWGVKGKLRISYQALYAAIVSGNLGERKQIALPFQR